MAIYGRYPERNFSLCPAGVHQAVIVDIVDVGEQNTKFGPKMKVRLAWQIADLDPADGHRYTVVKTYNNSMHKSASLRIDLNNWLGRPLTEDEAKRFDLERLLGVNATLIVVHNVADDGDTYANVAAVAPPSKGVLPLVSLDYIRHQDRPGRSGASPAKPTLSIGKPTPSPTKPAPVPIAPVLDTPTPVVTPPDDFESGANVPADGFDVALRSTDWPPDED